MIILTSLLCESSSLIDGSAAMGGVGCAKAVIYFLLPHSPKQVATGGVRNQKKKEQVAPFVVCKLAGMSNLAATHAAVLACNRHRVFSAELWLSHICQTCWLHQPAQTNMALALCA